MVTPHCADSKFKSNIAHNETLAVTNFTGAPSDGGQIGAGNSPSAVSLLLSFLTYV
jgi:hypothetical protein